MTCLIVKEDGKIYVNEVPEEPKKLTGWETKGGLKIEMGGDFGHDKAMRKYHEALASAKENAVLCASHNEAFFILQGHYMPKGAKEFKLTPGVYPI